APKLSTLRLRLTELLLQRVAEDAASPLDKAVQMLTLLDDPQGPRPAEAHFLLMLERDSPRVSIRSNPHDGVYLPPADLICLALKVRRRAERACLGLANSTANRSRDLGYAEEVFAWTKARINEADEKRRRAQDLLLSSDKGDWNRSRRLLTEAN